MQLTDWTFDCWFYASNQQVGRLIVDFTHVIDIFDVRWSILEFYLHVRRTIVDFVNIIVRPLILDCIV